jgi:SAM-dependent MidA family methyltransferase
MSGIDDAFARLIAADLPLTVERVMALSNAHYYAARDPFGATGDFVTAPEISQMFGEIVGVWAMQVWSDMGRPAPFALVELGPGRGTLMADLWRAARSQPAFRAAAEIHLVETSPVLRAAQAAALPDAAPHWHDDLATVPDLPAIIVANEFFDALPIRQFVRVPDGWRERGVGRAGAGRYRFVLGAEDWSEAIPAPLRRAWPGSIVETAPAATAVAATIGHRLASAGGAALIVDYGHAMPGAGDTLQAVRAHRFVDPLAHLGAADLTAHVDFTALAAAATGAGATACAIVDQRTLLQNLGIELRAATLKRAASPAGREAIDAAAARLTDPAATGMGALFKVLALTGPGQPVPPGLMGIDDRAEAIPA